MESEKSKVTVQTVALSCCRAWKKFPIHENELTARKQCWKTSLPLAMLVVRVHLASVTNVTVTKSSTSTDPGVDGPHIVLIP